jgi:hypothetical protein
MTHYCSEYDMVKDNYWKKLLLKYQLFQRKPDEQLWEWTQVTVCNNLSDTTAMFYLSLG